MDEIRARVFGPGPFRVGISRNQEAMVIGDTTFAGFENAVAQAFLDGGAHVITPDSCQGDEALWRLRTVLTVAFISFQKPSNEDFRERARGIWHWHLPYIWRAVPTMGFHLKARRAMLQLANFVGSQPPTFDELMEWLTVPGN